MLTKQIRNIAKVLFLLYIGYYGCVSYFVHSHVYEGVVYVHSHPYSKLQPSETGETDLPPFETHTHNAAGFFVLNQVSNILSFEASSDTLICTDTNYQTIPYKVDNVKEAASAAILHFDLRAPPASSSLYKRFA